jgi:mannose-1-phosphate guanylyltransferase
MSSPEAKTRRGALRSARPVSRAALATAARKAGSPNGFARIRERRLTAVPALESRGGGVWGAVLAGGDGTRLRPLVDRIHSDGRPKQFASVFGGRSLLRDTLDRVGILIPPERTLVVGRRSHEHFLQEELAHFPSATVLLQPDNRGTAAGVLLPAHWIARLDPEAVVAVFPSDHFILGSNAFMAHVSQAAAFAKAHPDRLLLVGAPPSRPEPDLGWVETGDSVGATASGPICRVVSFREKPATEDARVYFERGFLWNTFVIVGRASALVKAGRSFAPEVSAGIDRVVQAAIGGPEAFDRAFAELPPADFSRSILERCADRLVISRLPDRIWSDWGTPERVFESLAEAKMEVPAGLFPSAAPPERLHAATAILAPVSG